MKKCTRCGLLKESSEFYWCISYLKRGWNNGYSSQCKQCRTIVNKIRYKKNRLKYLKKVNIYHASPGVKEKRCLYRQNNREERRIKKRAYRHTKIGNINMNNQQHRRKAKLAHCAINDLTSTQIHTLLINARKCVICGKYFNKKRKKTIDHILSIFQGGNNSLLNIQIVCLSCNSKKQHKDYTDFNNGQLYMFLN